MDNPEVPEYTLSTVPTVVVLVPLDGDDFELYRFTVDEAGEVEIVADTIDPQYLRMYIAGLTKLAEELGV